MLMPHRNHKEWGAIAFLGYCIGILNPNKDNEDRIIK